MAMAMVACPVHENAVTESGGWGMVGAAPGDENRPENTADCPLPTIFTITVRCTGRSVVR